MQPTSVALLQALTVGIFRGIILTFSLLMALSFQGCNNPGDDEGDLTTASTQTTAPTTASTPADEGVGVKDGVFAKEGEVSLAGALAIGTTLAPGKKKVIAFQLGGRIISTKDDDLIVSDIDTEGKFHLSLPKKKKDG